MPMFNDVYATPSFGTPESHPTIGLTVGGPESGVVPLTVGGYNLRRPFDAPCGNHRNPTGAGSLSNDDVERIARRVAELLRATP